MKNKKKKVFINADATMHNFNAQNRNGKLWAIYLSKEKYDIYILSSDKHVDQRIQRDKHIKVIHSRNYFSLGVFFLRHFVLSQFDVILNAKVGKHIRPFIKFKKIFNKKTKLITFVVNQVPYGEPGSSYATISDYIITNSDIKIANSNFVSNIVHRYFGERIPVINNFIDLNIFKPDPVLLTKKRDRLRIVCVGSMICVKQPFLFAAIAKRFPQADFLWVGGRYYLEDMKEKKEKERIENLELIEKMPNSELPQILQKQDIFLTTSIQEGFANVILEALACGLPVIALNRYIPDAILTGKTGFIVNDEFEMLEKLQDLIDDEKMLNEFKVNAAKRALEFSGEKNIYRLEEIIDGL